MISAVRRSGWELIRTQSTVQVLGSAWLVRHELARRLGGPGHAADAATAAAPRGPGRAEPQQGVLQVHLNRDDLEAWAASSGDRNALHLRGGAAAQVGLEAGGGAVIAHGLLLGALSLALVPRNREVLEYPQPSGAPHPAGAGSPGAAGAHAELLGDTEKAGRATIPGSAGDTSREATGGTGRDDVLRFPAPLAVPQEGGARLLVNLDGSCMDYDNRLVLLRG